MTAVERGRLVVGDIRPHRGRRGDVPRPGRRCGGRHRLRCRVTRATTASSSRRPAWPPPASRRRPRCSATTSTTRVCSASTRVPAPITPPGACFNPIVHPDPGNHEYDDEPGAAGYFSTSASGADTDQPHRGYYSFNIGTWHIISLNSDCTDSGCSDPSRATRRRRRHRGCRPTLRRNRSACMLAYWHHPRFSDGWTHDSPGVARCGAPSTTHTPTSCSAATTTSTSVTRSRIRTGPRRPTACASSSSGRAARACSRCSPIRPTCRRQTQNDFGVLVLTLHASSYDWAFKRLNGTVVDSGTTACHGSGTGSLAARAVRDARADGRSGPTGPGLQFDVRPQPTTVARVERSGLPVAIHLSRRGRHLGDRLTGPRSPPHCRSGGSTRPRLQVSRPHSRILLRLPARG